MVSDLKRTSMVSGESSHFESGSYTDLSPRVSRESFLQASISFPFFHGPSGDARPSGSTRVPPLFLFMMEMLGLRITPLQPGKKPVHRQASGDSSCRGKNKKQKKNNACSY